MKALIMAGGSGTRLWPLSTKTVPKQFVKIFHGRSLFQKTILRLLKYFKLSDILITTTKSYFGAVLDQVRELGLDLPPQNILVEPLKKGTLAAMALAMHKFPNEKIAVFPSDHEVIDNGRFEGALKAAERLADKYIVLFGVVPRKAETGFGYIKPGKRIDGAYLVEGFVEKPPAEVAEKLVREGWLWNSSIYILNPKLLLAFVKKKIPEIAEVIERGEQAFYSLLRDDYHEKEVFTGGIPMAVVPLDVFWADLGSFESLYKILPKSSGGIASNTNFVSLDSKNCLVLTDKPKFVALIDVADLAVIEYGETLLVMPLSSSQKVKKLLKKIGIA